MTSETLAEIAKQDMENGLKYDSQETCVLLKQDSKKVMFSDFSVLDIEGTGHCIGQCLSRKPHASKIYSGDYLLSNQELKNDSFFNLFMKGPRHNSLLSDPELLYQNDQQTVPFLLIEPTAQDSAEMDLNSVYLFQNGDIIIQDKQTLEHHYIFSDKNTEKLLECFFGEDKDIYKRHLKNKAENDNKVHLNKMGELVCEKRDNGLIDFIKNKFFEKPEKRIKNKI